MEPTEIAAGTIQLRPWQPSDATEVFEACQDAEIQRWTTVPSPYTMTDAEEWVGTVAPGGWASGLAPGFAVKDAQTGRLLASVDLHAISPRNHSGEIGYWTAPWARGQGVMTAAVAAVCRWAFGTDLVGYIAWRASVGNLGSRRVAEKVGFTIEGTLRSEILTRTGRQDSWYGSLLPGELIR